MFELRDFSATAVTAHLVSDMDNLSDTITLDNSTGWPTGGVNGDFMVEIGDEVIRCASRTGNTVQVAGSGRGYDGTAATDHTASVEVAHVLSKIDLYEANVAASETVGKATAAGQLLVTDGVNSFVPLNNGTNGMPLVAGTTTPSYAPLGTAGYGDDTVTNAKMAPDSVGSTELIADSVGPTELAAASVGTTELIDLSVTTPKLDNLSVTQGKIEVAQQFEAGDLKTSARSSPTTGWLLCDGSAVDRSAYANLFSAIGVTYGNGNGSTTFNIPDFRGRSLIGAGTGSGLTGRTLGDTGGEEEHTILTAELPSHTHSIDHNHASATTSSDGAHTHVQNTGFVNAGIGAFGTGGGAGDSSTASNGAHTHSLDLPNFTGTSGAEGSGTAAAVMSPFVVGNVFIKT